MTNESFFYQALVYLATMVVFVPLAKKLNLGSVLGYLIGGIIIGPALLGLIGHGGEDLMHFAEFGVVMMLFLIGLELEPSLLWKLRAPILGLGGLQVAVTALAVTGVAMLAGLRWNEALVIGMILSLSSTAIVLQMLSEKGLMGSAAGQSSFSVLLFQDIAVIPMLAIFPLLAPAGAVVGGQEESASLIAGQPAWVRTLIVLGAVTALVIGGRYVVKPILHIVARTGLRELFTASALLLVVAIAVLMTLVGLSPALGAFLGGVVLANSEYRHELESDIEPFKGLLLGLFFIGVGATIDFQLIVERPLLVTGLVLGIMVLKFGVLLGLGKIFKLSREQNLLFAFALPQVGEFAFVLFSFAGGAALLDKDTVSCMMAVVAITMALTPLLMLLFEKVIQPRFGCAAGQTGREPDQIDERNPVIIAGFDHFGTVVGRFLRASGVKATVLDVDSDRVDLLRKMGLKVYYGDASRTDLLKSAGAEQARIIVIAMSTPEKNREVVAAVKKHFPHLQMLVRATDNNDAFDLMNDGVLRIYRETVDTSLRLASDVLELLGRRAYQSQRAARMFRRFDERSLKGLSAYRDDKQYVNVVRERIEELQKMIQADAYTNMILRDAGWDRDNAEERN